MSVITPEGLQVQMPAKRPRGQTIQESQARKMRDILAVVLVRFVGLTVPDALAVLHAGNICKPHLYRRLAEYPGDPEQCVRDLLLEAQYAAQERLGSASVEAEQVG